MKDRNARHLFEGISTDVVRYLVERAGMELTEAISSFHNSETFSKLEDFSTGLYSESPTYVYDLLQSELKKWPSCAITDVSPVRNFTSATITHSIWVCIEKNELEVPINNRKIK